MIWKKPTVCFFCLLLSAYMILQEIKKQGTVDGKNPAPPGMYKTLYIVG